MVAQLALPITGAALSDGYGPRPPITTGGGKSGGFHYGQDFIARSSTPILAAGDGRVIAAAWIGTYGYAVYIDHGDGLVTRYAHMRAAPLVKAGARVTAGQLLGNVGATGAATGPHLHFEVVLNGARVNPLPYLNTQSKGTIVRQKLRNQDRRERTLAPGAQTFLNKAGKDKNVVGGIGPYTIAATVNATGLAPGDELELCLNFQNTRNNPEPWKKASDYYTEQLIADRRGTIYKTVTFQPEIAAGDMVFVRVRADAGNEKPALIKLIDSNAYLYGEA